MAVGVIAVHMAVSVSGIAFRIMGVHVSLLMRVFVLVCVFTCVLMGVHVLLLMRVLMGVHVLLLMRALACMLARVLIRILLRMLASVPVRIFALAILLAPMPVFVNMTLLISMLMPVFAILPMHVPAAVITIRGGGRNASRPGHCLIVSHRCAYLLQ